MRRFTSGATVFQSKKRASESKRRDTVRGTVSATLGGTQLTMQS